MALRFQALESVGHQEVSDVKAVPPSRRYGLAKHAADAVEVRRPIEKEGSAADHVRGDRTELGDTAVEAGSDVIAYHKISTLRKLHGVKACVFLKVDLWRVSQRLATR